MAFEFRRTLAFGDVDSSGVSMILKTRFAETTPRVKVCERVLMREIGSNREPQAAMKAIRTPVVSCPLSVQWAPKATIRMIPDSAMKETPGQTIDWPRMTVMCFSPTFLEARSKLWRASGSTV